MAKYNGLLEKDVQTACMNYLKTLEELGKCYYVRTQSGSVQLAPNRRFKTGRKGCPDCIVCFQGGKYVGIEFKKQRGGEWSEEQQQAAKMIEKAGGKYLLVSSLQEMIDDLKLII